MKGKLAMTIKEACYYASLSRSTIYNLNRSGALPIRKVVGRSLILTEDLVGLLKGSRPKINEGEGRQ